MATMRNVVILAVIAMLLKLSMAANYTVGGSNGGWDTSTNLQAWAASQSFLVGDNLIFQYGPNHNLFEVTKADYNSCQTSNAIQVHSDGSSVIPLSSPGTRYFICGTSGHCNQGMKVEIDILATSTPPPTSPINPPTPSPSPVIPPLSSPSPKTFIPSPSQSQLETTPTMSPFEGPESISPSPHVSLSPPSPSSATEDGIRTSVTISFSIVMMMNMILVL